MTIRKRFKEKHPRIYARIIECQKEQGNKPYDVTTLKKAERWARGTYAVFLEEYGGHPKGTVSKITGDSKFFCHVEHKHDNSFTNCILQKDTQCIWFATRGGAEAFAKTLTKVEVELVVGQWYFLNCYSNNYKVKYNNGWKTCDYIAGNMFHTKGFFNNPINIKPLTDLSEIQQYLPLGHPDKVSKVEYEVGKWYKAVDRNYFGKFLRIGKNGHFVVTEGILTRNSSDYFEYEYPFDTGYTWIPATIEELRNFLPEGHIDRQETKTETMEEKFKNGDYVVSKNEDVILIYPNNKTTGIRLSTFSFVTDNTFRNCSNFRIATQEEKEWLDRCITAEKYVERYVEKVETMEEFKVGDWLWGKVITRDKEELCRFVSKTENYIECNFLNNNKKDYDLSLYINSSDFHTVRKALPHEIPINTESKSNIMSNEELLAYAREHYPVGTVFKCLHNCQGGPIIEEDYEIDSNRCIRVLNGCGCIYDDILSGGKWATIVSTPKVEEIVDDKLKVGDRVKCVIPYSVISIGMTGVLIKNHTTEKEYVGIKWDNFTKGHNLDGALSKDDVKKGWYVGKENVKKIPNNQKSVFPVEQIKEQVKVVNNQTTNNKVLLLPTKEIYVRKSKNN